MKIPENYLQDVYAGWLGKIIGIRVGAPDESWTAEQIYKAVSYTHLAGSPSSP